MNKNTFKLIKTGTLIIYQTRDRQNILHTRKTIIYRHTPNKTISNPRLKTKIEKNKLKIYIIFKPHNIQFMETRVHYHTERLIQ